MDFPTLTSIHTDLLAQYILSQTSTSTSVMVFEPDVLLAEVVVDEAAKRSIEVVLLTTQAKSCTIPWVYVHPRASKSLMRRLLPLDRSILVVLADQSEVPLSIQRALPDSCQVVRIPDRCGDSYQRGTSTTGIRRASEQLRRILLKRSKTSSETVNTHCLPRLELSEISLCSPYTAKEQSILHWESQQTIPVRVKPASQEVSFVRDKTYWLVGLTGGLGLSLCQWMISHGVRYIVLSSRTPQIDDEWVKSRVAEGSTIKIISRYVHIRLKVHSCC